MNSNRQKNYMQPRKLQQKYQIFFGKKKKKMLTVKIENPRAREEQDTTLYESEADFSLMD